MDALDALSTERPVLSARVRRERVVAVAPTSPADDLARARRLLAQLPVLVDGSWSPPAAADADDAAIRLTAALWELAARHDLAIAPEDTATQLARTLAACGALVPPAADAVALVERVLAEPPTGEEAEVRRAAARLTAYLELRARFG